MIDEGDISCIHCKMGLRGPKSVWKVDDLSLVFFNFYAQALTPRLNGTETSLQLSKSITLVAVCRIYARVINKET
jgi:hypothetical protein